jgi:hypothetical protein
MPVSVRYFGIDDKEGIHRIPASRFYRVLAGEEPAPELSGRQIRLVEAAIRIALTAPPAVC